MPFLNSVLEVAVFTFFSQQKNCRAQNEMGYINVTLCPSGTFFDTDTCACEDIHLHCPNDCNGHGTCNYMTGICNCDSGYGSENDVSDYKAFDCSLRSCPSALEWGGVATSSISARVQRECAGVGICNKLTGVCNCRPGFFGDACELSGCPNDCSNHGSCVSMAAVCEKQSIAPVDDTTATYGLQQDDTAWDAQRIYGCVCDSSWEVGLSAGALQVPEYHQADCSSRRCPSGDDPVTIDVDETDCEGINGGLAGNLCYVPCSNRGVCNEETGVCKCNVGFAGEACSEQLIFTSRRL